MIIIVNIMMIMSSFQLSCRNIFVSVKIMIREIKNELK